MILGGWVFLVSGVPIQRSRPAVEAYRGTSPIRKRPPPSALPPSLGVASKEIGKILPNNQRQRRTCYALCRTLCTVSAAYMSFFLMNSNSTCYVALKHELLQGYLAHGTPPPPSRTLQYPYA